MIHPDDVVAWLVQVRQNPEAAPGIIEALAERLLELDKQNEALRDELLRLRQGGEGQGDAGRVAVLARRVQVLERQLEQGLQGLGGGVARSLVVFTLDGRAARLSLPDPAGWGQRSDPVLAAPHLRPRHLLVGAEDEELLLFSDKGRSARLNVADVEPADAPVAYLSLLPGLRLDLDESISAIAAINRAFEQLTLVTRKGYVRGFRRVEVDSFLERGMPLHSSPVPGDYPAYIVLGGGRGELAIVTRMGKGVRFPERVVGVQSEPGIKLDRGDVVVGAAVVDDQTTLVLLNVDGTAAGREMAGFGAHSTAGNQGKLLTRMENVVGAAPVTGEDTLWILTEAGQLHAVPAAEVPSGPGASGGKAVIKPGKDRVVALAVT